MEFQRKSSLALGAALVLFSFTAFGNASVGAFTAARAQTAPADATSEDFKAVQAVCSRCHGVALFLNKPRPWNRWNEVFIRMTGHGAHPTEEQVDHIVRFFLANLTDVDINTSPADELGPVLGVPDKVANAIIARREVRKFRDISDLLSLPGVDPAIVQQRKSRIHF
jgi:DNA uptake protein ComE-like DNA-binding protein